MEETTLAAKSIKIILSLRFKREFAAIFSRFCLEVCKLFSVKPLFNFTIPE
ncbi:MAG: hypothetical protein JO297_02110 [Nitrososphaeraceae archaeon]|nr:hypothetical protein [Nitrososphaeraceae archaeon]